MLIKYPKKRKWLTGIGVGILLIVVLAAARVSDADGTVSQARVEIQPDSGIYFVTQQEVLAMISPGTGRLGENISGLEDRLNANPYIRRAEVFSGPRKRHISVHIWQRIPVLRVMDISGGTYYLDENGFKMPFSQSFTPLVAVATGNIREKLTDSTYPSTPVLKDLFKVASFVHGNPFWKAQIEQLHVDNSGELLLIPRVGNHTIVIGNADSLEQKFEKLRLFCVRALNSVGWNQYSVINLQYHQQVVAIKRNEKDSIYVK